jgi:hypothetical protein
MPDVEETRAQEAQWVVMPVVTTTSQSVTSLVYYSTLFLYISMFVALVVIPNTCDAAHMFEDCVMIRDPIKSEI